MILNLARRYRPGVRSSSGPLFLFEDGFVEFQFGLVQLLCSIIIADGGCTCPGDLSKAFAAGADFVMLGGMLAGHDEGGGDVITRYYKTGEVEKAKNGWQDCIEERKFVQFYGMSSRAANEKHFGGLKEYRSSEGRDILVPYRGEIGSSIQDLLGGIRSTCTYAGAKKLKWLSKCTTFVKTGQQYHSVFSG